MPTATKTAPQQQVGLPALDLRRMIGQLVSAEGYIKGGDLVVSATGGAMSVTIAAGAAFVKDDHAGGGGYYAATWKTADQLPIQTADPSNPRVDRVVLRVRDAFLNDSTSAIDYLALPGTPTANATLANPYGAATVPGSCLLLANVLVSPGVNQITSSDIDAVVSPAGLFGRSSQRVTTMIDITNNDSPTDLLSAQVTLPGGVLGTGRRARLWASGDYVTNQGTNPGPRFALRVGGQFLLRSAYAPAPASGSSQRKGWQVRCDLMNLASAYSQEVAMVGQAQFSTGGSFATGEGTYSATAVGRVVGRATTSFDSTVDQTFEFLSENRQGTSSLETALYAAVLVVE